MAYPIQFSCTDYASFKSIIAQHSLQPQFVEVFYKDYQDPNPIVPGGPFAHHFDAYAIDYKLRIFYVLQTLTGASDQMPATFAADFPAAINQTGGVIQSYSL